MNKADFFLAIDIITEHHSTELIVNGPIKGFVDKSIYRLQIRECVPSVINKLKEQGFMLSMQDGLLEVQTITPIVK